MSEKIQKLKNKKKVKIKKKNQSINQTERPRQIQNTSTNHHT